MSNTFITILSLSPVALIIFIAFRILWINHKETSKLKKGTLLQESDPYPLKRVDPVLKQRDQTPRTFSKPIQRKGSQPQHSTYINRNNSGVTVIGEDDMDDDGLDPADVIVPLILLDDLLNTDPIYADNQPIIQDNTDTYIQNNTQPIDMDSSNVIVQDNQPSYTPEPSYQPSYTPEPSYQPSYTPEPSYQPSYTPEPSYTPSYEAPSYTPDTSYTPSYDSGSSFSGGSDF